MFHFFYSLGTTRAWFLGSGHIHMDHESAFNGDAQLFRDFIVDLINHSALYRGPLSADSFSAKDVREHLSEVQDVVRNFDLGLYKDIGELAKAFKQAGLNKKSNSGINAVNEKYLTTEVRFFRSANNTQEIFAFLELIKARLNYLKLNPNVPLKPSLQHRTRHQQYMELQSYVKTSGLDWDIYESMIPRWWRVLAKMKSFTRAASSCERYFSFST